MLTYTIGEHTRKARERWTDCQRIAKIARDKGLNATPKMVNHRYDVWRQWAEGRLATGYLMRMTGVKRIKR